MSTQTNIVSLFYSVMWKVTVDVVSGEHLGSVLFFDDVDLDQFSSSEPKDREKYLKAVELLKEIKRVNSK